MIVYGDREHREPAALVLRRVAAALEAAGTGSPVQRHGALISASIAAGQLWQGLADHLGADGMAEPPPAVEAAAALATALGRLVLASMDGSITDHGRRSVAARIAACEPLLPAEPITVRDGEGTAFYALYPEAVAVAAKRLGPGPWRVVGIRSIGTTLGALAAAALGAGTPESLRPVGHPFARTIEAHDAIRRRLTEGDVRVAIVDEGPGLSGSSFGAVADWLEDGGFPRQRLAFLPSHDGNLGTMANDRHRRRWREVQRSPAATDTILFGEHAPGGGLSGWIADAVGPLLAPPVQVGGGVWRLLGGLPPERWPASFRLQEKVKALGLTERGPVLAKFAGLGEIGARKAAMADVLGAEGWSVRPHGLRHGFLVAPWFGATAWGAAAPEFPTMDPDRWIRRLAGYLAFRRRHFQGGTGASIAGLKAMADHNLTQAGLPAADLLQPFVGQEERLQARVRPMAVDGRLLPHEWIADPDGRVLKTDALDHHAAHDLIGCQDVAWDVAGAAVEFGLDRTATDDLRRRTAVLGGVAIDGDLTGFYRLAYAAFQIGRSTLAAGADGDPVEIARHERDIARYRSAAAEPH